jgi:hypothetical protein
MSVSGLLQGRVIGEIQTRPTKTGGHVTFFKMKVTSGNATEFWSISTFSDTAREELSGLSDGDAISVVGALSAELFEWKGEKRISLKIMADRVLPLKPKPPKPRATPGRQAEASNTGRALVSKSWASPARQEKSERGNAPFMPGSDIPLAPEWR